MRHRSFKRVATVLAGVFALGGSLVGVVASSAPETAGADGLPPLLVTPNPVSIGSATLGDFTVKQVQVMNTSGSTDMITGATVSGTNPADFSALPDFGCPYLDQTTLVINLPTAQSCMIDFFFFPGALGNRSATITLVDSADSNTSIPVSGTGSIGYYQVADDGTVAYFGDAGFFGDASQTPLNFPIVGMAQTGDDGGYWLAASDGGIFNYGDAAFLGSAGGIRLNKPMVGMASTGTGNGYWLVATDGGIFSYGDAQFFGSTGGMTLNKPIVGMAATNDGGGYWLVASDGGIFAYGDAQFFGSTGGMPINKPIVGMAPTPDDGGYWLVAADGGIFAYGDAQFYGSTGALHLNQPITAMAPMPTGNGYFFTATDSGLFNYGDAPFLGSGASLGLSTVVGMATDGAPTVQAVFDQAAVRHAVPHGSNGWATPPNGDPRYAGPS